MTISDLLDKKSRGIFSDDKILKCELIALDAKDGRILFDTLRHTRTHIDKFKNGEILSLWADMRSKGLGEWNNYFIPVMKCYVSHDSWKRGDAE